MRPPHDSAMSSGWGDTKTWVIGGRGYQRSRVSEAMLANERHEHCRLEGFARESFIGWTHQGDHLVAARADRDRQPAVRQQLFHQGDWNLRRCRSHDYGGEGCLVWRPGAAITDDDLDVVAEVSQARLRLGGQERVALDRDHVRAHRGEHGRLVATARANVEDLGPRTIVSRGPSGQHQCLRHRRDDVWLRDCLAVADRQGTVVIGRVRQIRWDEHLARHGAHRLQHQRVPYATLFQLYFRPVRIGSAYAAEPAAHFARRTSPATRLALRTVQPRRPRWEPRTALRSGPRSARRLARACGGRSVSARPSGLARACPSAPAGALPAVYRTSPTYRRTTRTEE